jgi:hypothetical protein
MPATADTTTVIIYIKSSNVPARLNVVHTLPLFDSDYCKNKVIINLNGIK